LRDGVRDGLIDPQYGTLTVQARLLAERCQTLTPPRDLAQGRAAVARDLTRIYRPLDARTFESKSLQKIVRTDNRASWDAASKHFPGPLRNTTAIGFSESWHSRWRTRRGRTGSPRKDNVGVVTLGAEAKQAREYLKRIQQRVGWAKAGWNMGILAFGGTVKNAWVSRHGVARGRVVDGRLDRNPFVQVVNDTGWAKTSNEGDRILRNAVAARARDMDAYVTRMMKLAADRASSTVAIAA
jgi:hypothetical protein